MENESEPSPDELVYDQQERGLRILAKLIVLELVRRSSGYRKDVSEDAIRRTKDK